MEDHLKDRIVRSLDDLEDDKGYQILDFVEFLESKYASRSAPDNVFTRLTDKVEDTLRAAKAPADAIAGTVGFMGGASKVVRDVASAAQSVVEEATKVAKGSPEDQKSSLKEDGKPDSAKSQDDATG